MKFKNLTTLADKIIIVCVFLIAVFIFVLNLNFNDAGNTVSIEVDGTLYGEYELSVPQVISVNSNHGYNLVKIDSNSVYVAETSCKERYEIGTKISKSGQCIVCLPNRMIIRILGNKEVDGVTY